MNRILHHLEAGVVFMFAATIASAFTLLYFIGAGLWSIWILSLCLVYALGRVGGADAVRRSRDESRWSEHE